MIKAAIYARYSSASQREASVEDQIKECRKFADEMEFTVVRVYADRAISGTTDHRPDFQRMIADSAKHQFEYLILYTLDRFARDRYDHAHYKRLLRQNGVKVCYATQRIPDNPEGVILESVLEGYSEYYSKELSRKINRGLLHNAENCMSVGGSVPLGYKIVDHHYVIHEANAKVVQTIYEMYADGSSAQEIIRWLNDRNIKTAKGNSFNKGSLETILTNRKYIGYYIYKDIVKEGGMPRIISDDLFDRVQRRLKIVKAAKAHTKGNADYLLTTKLFCGYCKSPMVGESGTSQTGATHFYYKCAARKRSPNKCHKHTEKKDIIEWTIVRETVHHVLTPDNIKLIAQRAVEIIEKEYADNALLKDYEARLKNTEKSIHNILKAIEAGIFTASTKDRLEELEKEKVNLITQIDLERAKKPRLSKERIEFWLHQFARGDINDVEYRRRVIDTLVNSVYIYDGDDDGERRIVINYNLSSNNTSVVKSSDFVVYAPPQPENPNFFFLPRLEIFGLSIKTSVL